VDCVTEVPTSSMTIISSRSKPYVYVNIYIYIYIFISFVCTKLTIGSLLGEGGFCIVHTITKIQLNAHEPILEHDQMMRENLIKSNNILVVKRIRNDLIESEESKAIADLALEVSVDLHLIE